MRSLIIRRLGRLVMGSSMTLVLVATLQAPLVGAAANRPYFSAARNLWLSEAAMVSGALQNVPLVAAVHDLERGLAKHHAGVDGYQSAIATLKAFERIPLTSETSSQMKASHRDWAALNAFFDITPKEETILDNAVPSGHHYDAAQRAWQREPSGVHGGVSVALLEIVVSNVRAARAAQPGRALMYQAALVDALSLEHARPSELAATSASLLDPYTQDIYYLNVFFEASRLTSPAAPQ
jgi:hypothetical protein